MSELDVLPAVGRLAHGQVVMLDRRRLLPATYQFNPTIATHDRALWMVYRRITPDEWLAGPRTVGLCRLGADLQPDPESNVDLSARIEDPPGADRWHADPRLFHRGNELWLSYHDNYRLYVTPIDPSRLADRLRPTGIDLAGRSPRERERNWGFFEDGDFKAVYSIPSHVVLKLRETGTRFEASPLYENGVRLPWDVARWGEPHGGCMPSKVGNHWFAFFQSASYDASTDRRHYYVGFYGFEAEPPHRVAFMSVAPLLAARDFEGELSFYKDWAVVYPSGAVYLDGRWLVSLGVHDRKPALAAFDHPALLRECVAL